ncbi:MAG: penicillin-binding transpeptidase domain-containing protein, partial [Eubacteriales bacterium]|nr:penicillin-binding transpeptidase domain-containing protein [Eubacteriales bacterium]
MPETTLKNKRRLIIVFVLVCLACTALSFRVGWISIVKSEEYTKLAREQQTKDTPIPAKRGIIYDRNKKELAVSALTNTIWARPEDIKGSKTEEEQKKNLSYTADTLSKILEMDRSEIMKTLTSEKKLLKVAKYVDDKKAEKIREAKLPGISIAEDVKRYYPLGNFAAHVLGSTTDDNVGLSGIELKYDKYLAGTPGRWIKNTDVSGDSLSYGIEKYFQAEDGLSVMLTIDAVIQHYVEEEVAAVQKRTSAKRVMCLMMDPKTGDILAMAMTPDFDPNDPRTPTDPEKKKVFNSLPEQDQMAFWNEMWRNPMVSDTYEPGSTFKLITTAIALEERVTNPSATFTCTGSIDVYGTTLHCWRRGNPHGLETLAQAVQNSCNPVFVQLGLRIGLDKYYNYIEKFGLTEKTGIDYPGEGGNILQNKDTAGPVGMATMSYGHGIAVTPISLLTALCAIGNDGMLMEPRLVKALLDKNGHEVESFAPEMVRQVISQETADEMSVIMESV